MFQGGLPPGYYTVPPYLPPGYPRRRLPRATLSPVEDEEENRPSPTHHPCPSPRCGSYPAIPQTDSEGETVKVLRRLNPLSELQREQSGWWVYEEHVEGVETQRFCRWTQGLNGMGVLWMYRRETTKTRKIFLRATLEGSLRVRKKRYRKVTTIKEAAIPYESAEEAHYAAMRVCETQGREWEEGSEEEFFSDPTPFLLRGEGNPDY